MTDNDQLRAMLLVAHERLRDRVGQLEADLNGLAQARRSESDDDEHDPEGETLSAQWSMRAGVLESARTDLRQTEDALQRLEDGRYGVCTVCGNPIPFEQLEVRPFRESCVKCAS